MTPVAAIANESNEAAQTQNKSQLSALLQTQTQQTSNENVVQTPLVAFDISNCNNPQKNLKSILCNRKIVSSPGTLTKTTFHHKRAIQPTKRIGFAVEYVCPFDKDEPSQSIAAENPFLQKIKPAAPAPPSPAVSYSIISSSSPSSISPVGLRFQTSPIVLESIHIIPSKPSSTQTTASLLCTFLVQNWHFEKQISITYTTTSWRQTLTTELATFIPPNDTSSPLDRFSLEFQVDTESSGTPLLDSDDHIVKIELAVKCVMGGNEYWDNNNGSNHLILLHGSTDLSSEQLPVPTATGVHAPRKINSFLDLESASAMKRKATMLAVKRGFSMAKEAQEIKEEFEKERRWHDETRRGSLKFMQQQQQQSFILESQQASMALFAPNLMPIRAFPLNAPCALSSAEYSAASRLRRSDSPLYAEPGLLMEIPLSSSPRY
ncbi:UNVERIFIED_CONTAM: hypothetical protein HDU68_012719 [Siphonaria sp. JEL0065]|nr:hypothetical protein HDU68_012719 [Siphonaria sp. JEL0065]